MAVWDHLPKFGNILGVEERTREGWSLIWIEQVRHDVRYGLRVLRHNPGFMLVAILALALGIGVNTAVFSMVNAVLVRPLPYPDADRIVAYSDGVTRFKAEHFKPGIAGTDFFDWRTLAKSFDGMAGYFYTDATLATFHDAGQARTASVAGDFWAITGARPVLGRLFEPQAPQGDILLPHRFFERRFGSDPHIVGQAMTLDGRPATIAGVLPADFHFLFPQDRTDLSPSDIEAYVPAPPLGRPAAKRCTSLSRRSLSRASRSNGELTELKLIETRILKAYPDRWFSGVARMRLMPLRERLVGDVRRALLILQVGGVCRWQ
jgi:hypothetical protein